MMFIRLNDGRRLNTFHIFKAILKGNQIIYQSPKGSAGDITETFETPEQASTRYSELESCLLAETPVSIDKEVE